MANLKALERASDAMMRRLPAYYRQLTELEALGFIDLSSKDLARRMNLTDSQIRHDFNAFGGFGRRGRGYNVVMLRRSIGDILDINRPHDMIVIGAGNIGRALAQYAGFQLAGFRITAMFDVDEELVGKRLAGVKVYNISGLSSYLKKHPTDIAIICTPADTAQMHVDALVRGGVKGIWNFAAIDLTAPEGIKVSNVHLTDSLMMLTFRMHEHLVLDDKEKWVQAE
ncbi:MAG: redox-sensing transcriptional repressor Rex [Christensenellales bacterium]